MEWIYFRYSALDNKGEKKSGIVITLSYTQFIEYINQKQYYLKSFFKIPNSISIFFSILYLFPIFRGSIYKRHHTCYLIGRSLHDGFSMKVSLQKALNNINCMCIKQVLMKASLMLDEGISLHKVNYFILNSLSINISKSLYISPDSSQKRLGLYLMKIGEYKEIKNSLIIQFIKKNFSLILLVIMFVLLARLFAKHMLYDAIYALTLMRKAIPDMTLSFYNLFYHKIEIYFIYSFFTGIIIYVSIKIILLAPLLRYPFLSIIKNLFFVGRYFKYTVKIRFLNDFIFYLNINYTLQEALKYAVLNNKIYFTAKQYRNFLNSLKSGQSFESCLENIKLLSKVDIQDWASAAYSKSIINGFENLLSFAILAKQKMVKQVIYFTKLCLYFCLLAIISSGALAYMLSVQMVYR